MKPNGWLEPAHQTLMINACSLEVTKIINKLEPCTYSRASLIITELNISSKMEPNQDAKLFCKTNPSQEQEVYFLL